MSEERWKSPGSILGIISALVAVVGLYFAFRGNVRDDVKTTHDIEITDDANRRAAEKDYQNKKELEEKKDRLEEQITALKSQIRTCDDNIGRANMQMAVTCGEADDDHQRRCQEAQDYKKSNEDSKSNLESKKADLEKQLNAL